MYLLVHLTILLYACNLPSFCGTSHDLGYREVSLNITIMTVPPVLSDIADYFGISPPTIMDTSY